MRRILGCFILTFSIIASPIALAAQATGSGSGMQPSGQLSGQQSGQPGSMTGSATEPQTSGSGRTYGEVNQPGSPGYETDEARGGFDFGWLGLLGLAGLLGLRHTTNRNAAATR